MPSTLAEFFPLKPAEQKLVDWLQAGERGLCMIGQKLPPETPPEDKILRATFVRYLALGGCDACRLPETGLRVRGAYIEGDDKKGEVTPGLDLEGARLTHDLGLLSCRFPDLLLLRSANLRNVFINGSYFHHGFRANRLTCSGSVLMRRVKAQGALHLLGARIGGNLDLAGAKLKAVGKSLNADGAQLSGVFFLREGTEVAGAIDLTAAQIGAINDDPDCWPQEILLDRCRYGAFLGPKAPVTAEARLKWLALQRHDEKFRSSPYEQCAKVLREMGYGGEATKVLIEKERLQRRARRERLRKQYLIEDAWGRAVWDRIMAYTVRYGRQPLWAFVWLIGVWLLGAMVFAQANALGAMMPNHPHFQLSPAWIDCHDGPRRHAAAYPHQQACFTAQPEALSYTSFSSLAYSADTLFPLVSLEIQDYWIPDNRTPWGAFARFYLWVHIAVGWGLSLLAVAGFSGLIKSDNSS